MLQHALQGVLSIFTLLSSFVVVVSLSEGTKMRKDVLYVYLAQLLQLCPTSFDPMDCSPPSSSVHGFSRQEHWIRLPPPSPGDFADPGIKHVLPEIPSLQEDSLPLSHWGSPVSYIYF